MIDKEFLLVRPIAMIADMLAVLLSFVAAYQMRLYVLRVVPFGAETELGEYYGLVLSIVLLWWGIFNLQGAYSSSRFTSMAEECNGVIKTVCLGTLIILSGAYLLKTSFPPRSIIVMFALVNTLFMCMDKYVVYQWFCCLRRYGYHKSTALIVGTGEDAQRFLDSVLEKPEIGLEVTGIVCIDSKAISPGEKVSGITVLGDSGDFVDILHNNPIDEVIFAATKKELEIDAMIHLCEEEGVKVRIMMELLKNGDRNINVERLFGYSFLTLTYTPQQEWQIFLKRVLDIIISLVALIILAPFFLLIAIAIKLDDGQAVFYEWQVVWFNKKPFTSWKFRSMVVDADKQKEGLMDKNEMQGPVFKLKDDPRITRVGRFLRKYSLDELPQIYSVLKGDMSLVGPRPPLVSEVSRFDKWYRRKLSVKPGITCLWQVQGRNKISKLDQWVRLDLEYIDNWSLWLDLKILFKTVGVVLAGSGR